MPIPPRRQLVPAPGMMRHALTQEPHSLAGSGRHPTPVILNNLLILCTDKSVGLVWRMKLVMIR
jgi:hypothetical protein